MKDLILAFVLKKKWKDQLDKIMMCDGARLRFIF